MLPTSLLLLSAIILPLTTATTPMTVPKCRSSTEGFPVSWFRTATSSVCNLMDGPERPNSQAITITSREDPTKTITLRVPPYAPIGHPSCTLQNCSSAYDSLLQGCQYNSHTIYGQGSLRVTCGTYYFHIGNVSTFPQPTSSTSFTTPSPTESSSTTLTPITTPTPTPTGGDLGSAGSVVRISGWLLLGVACGMFLL